MAQALADEWSDDKIKVNVVCPERTCTPMRINAFGKEDESTLLTADDVATQALKLLLGDQTGQVIEIRLKK